MRARLSVVALAYVLLGGTALSAQALPHPRLMASRQTLVSHDSVLRSLSLPDSVALTRMHRARRGAIVGAVSLGVLGMLVTSQAETGCDLGEGDCAAGRRKIALTAYGLVLGATAGAITGGVIGFAWPLPRSTRKP